MSRNATGFLEVGGFTAMREKYFQAIPSKLHNVTECGLPPKNAFTLWRDVNDEHLPWTGVAFGLTISATWYWCSDQVKKKHLQNWGNMSAKGCTAHRIRSKVVYL